MAEGSRARVSVARWIGTAAVGVLAVVVVGVGYRFVRADLESSVYRERLEVLAGELGSLKDQYNEVVRRTAVTELLVKDGKLSVRVRRADGSAQEIATPYDPAGEIYVDFVVLDGRLWVRRVFDAQTPPSRGLVIDPALSGVDWDAGRAYVGKAVYRSLAEGRWVVTVTGDGSLGLRRAEALAADEGELEHAPEVREYERIVRDADERVERIGFGEVWRYMFGG